jgi:small subunit ribosomal protein S6
MPEKKPLYDLMVLLETNAPSEIKTKILSDAEATIAKGGEVVSKHDYGLRETTFEINKKKDAEYHLIQFHGTPDVLATLDRTLRITDGVQRFRIIKLAPGTPAAPDLKARAQADAPPAQDDFADDAESVGAA